jgi:DNA-binding CsgD family transcriptional regulator
MRRLERTGGEDSYELLSPREREILQLVAEGKSSKEIANLLNLSVYTVETHCAKLMQTLNLRSVPEVILYAVRKGIISCPRGTYQVSGTTYTDLIGIGAAVTRRPLPHHRAYGSVHGGSRRLR